MLVPNTGRTPLFEDDVKKSCGIYLRPAFFSCFIEMSMLRAITIKSMNAPLKGLPPRWRDPRFRVASLNPPFRHEEGYHKHDYFGDEGLHEFVYGTTHNGGQRLANDAILVQELCELIDESRGLLGLR